MVTNAQASKWSGCRLFSKVCGVGGGSLEFPVIGRVSGKFLHELTPFLRPLVPTCSKQFESHIKPKTKTALNPKLPGPDELCSQEAREPQIKGNTWRHWNFMDFFGRWSLGTEVV